MRAEFSISMSALRDDFNASISALRDEYDASSSAMRKDLNNSISAVRTDIALQGNSDRTRALLDGSVSQRYRPSGCRNDLTAHLVAIRGVRVVVTAAHGDCRGVAPAEVITRPTIDAALTTTRVMRERSTSTFPPQLTSACIVFVFVFVFQQGRGSRGSRLGRPRRWVWFWIGG
jgi:hypothetical protein